MKTKIRKRRILRGAGKRFRRRGPAPPKRDTRDTAVLVGGARDPAEKSADRAAEQVMAGKKITSLAPAGAAVHRACADCDEKDKKKDKAAKRSAKGGPSVAPGAKAGRADSKASNAIRSMGPGKPLSRADRAYFEPRFGRELSEIRIHDGPAADRAARAIDARAFAYGSDIAFAAGERERGGAHLLSHELAHIAAGDGGGQAQRMVHRATIATADGRNPFKFKKVPPDHRREVQRALNIISRVLITKKCQDYFEDNCTLGAAETAKASFDAANVYYSPGDKLGLSELPHSIGYNDQAFKAGHWDIAATLIHELFHTCDKDDLGEVLAEGATEACGFYSPVLDNPLADEVYVGDTITVTGIQLGPKNDANHYIEMDGIKMASDKWEQGSNARSNIVVEFKVPATMLRPGAVERKVGIVAVNHGFRSEPKTVTVHAPE